MTKAPGVGPGFGGSWAGIDPPLSTWILEVIQKMGFDNMTPVQSSTIPRALKNQDCVVEAVTGSGKTLAFVVPVLERICRSTRQYKKGEVAAVVIVPTRELAQQIYNVFHLFLSSSALHSPDPGSPVASSSRSPPPSRPAVDTSYHLPHLVTSGTQTPYETFLAQSSNILIGTPGRLAAFLLSPRGLAAVRCSELDVLVLDEADRLLSAPDHRRDVERIMRHLPKQRRTHLFSATMTDAVEEIIGLGLRNPVRIVVNLKDKRKGEEPKERRTPTGLQNMYLVCSHGEKTLQMVRLLLHETTKHRAAKYIVYFSTCAAVDYFYRIMSRLPALHRYHLTSLHGDLPTRIRETALSTFVSHPSSHLSPSVLLCTDVAARGVDFLNVDVVLQYDPPTDPKTFSHRAGRTARAGKIGKAIVLLGRGREEDYVEFLAVRKIPLIPQLYLDADLQEESEEPMTVDNAAIQLLSDIRQIVVTDRELADKVEFSPQSAFLVLMLKQGAKAFVSSLRAYTKHEASFIFRLVDLDLGSVATAYGLLRLPAMPEIKEWRKRRNTSAKGIPEQEVSTESNEATWRDAEINVRWDTFAYSSKPREAARLASVLTKRDKDNIPDEEKKAKRKIRAEFREAWSEQKERKERREDRQTRKDKRKQAEWEKRQSEGIESLGPVAAFKLARKELVEHDEVDADYRTLKREVKEERATKKAKKEEDDGAINEGLFGDMI
ncbi:MAG: ATP-dependent rRNA helicase spb4 [Tremellales sp. Tagirdzhanova-0007]|nr:MAG: ATP-dependent rRNA helicase spb4 [Tremellales sp. Tagirdzhanova-0007]